MPADGIIKKSQSPDSFRKQAEMMINRNQDRIKSLRRDLTYPYLTMEESYQPRNSQLQPKSETVKVVSEKPKNLDWDPFFVNQARYE